MAEPASPRRARLGNRLREIRARAFRSGSEMARAFDPPWQQTKVSKLELGRQLPTQAELEAWLRVCDADDALDELTDLLGAARLDYRPWGEAWQTPGGIAAVQEEIAELDESATLIAEYQPALIPGLVQTPAYAREMLSAPAGPVLLGAAPDQIEERVSALVRRQRFLYDPAKRIQILVGEGALYTYFGSRATLLGQLDRLETIAALGNVDVGVLRFDRPMPLLPVGGFAVNDEIAAWVETQTGELPVGRQGELVALVKMFKVSLGMAAVGDESVAAIHEARKTVTEWASG